MKQLLLCLTASFLLITVILSCSDDSNDLKDTPTLQQSLPGTWETISIFVDVKTAEGKPDSGYTFRVEEENWKEMLQVSPIQISFKPDSTYAREYRALNGDVINKERGLWYHKHDTLYLIDETGQYDYLVTVEKGMATFRTTLDWDGDNVRDDLYSDRRRKISDSYK